MALHYQDISVDSILVKSEMNKIALKNHNLAIIVVAILNPMFSISDYFTAQSHWLQFLILRLVITTIFVTVFIFQHKLKIEVEWPAFIAYLGCIVENSYMYNVIDAPTLQKFTFAFIATYIGAGMMAVWRISFSIWAIVISLILNALFYCLWSPLSVEDYMSNGAFLTLMVAIFSIILIHTRYNLTIKEVTSRLKLEAASEEIAEKNKNITDSITYAQRIQNALLPPDETINNLFADHFVIYKPKDIVSGDFYWFAKIENQGKSPIVFIVAADCTGHGVPGAFMSMLGIASLNEIINGYEKIDAYLPNAGEILNELRYKIKSSLRQTGRSGEQKDGMDMALCIIDYSTKKLHLAGANNPVLLIRNDELIEFKGDRMPIGIHIGIEKKFTNHSQDFKNGDIIYLFSDGFVDQFGGKEGRKFLIKNLKRLLLQIHKESLVDQKRILLESLENWCQNFEQVDDILILGFKIDSQ